MAQQRLPPFSQFAPLPPSVKIVDIGANPIDGERPYEPLRKIGIAHIVGFDPNPAALQELNAGKGANDIYLPHAVGDGREHMLRVCKGPGLTSLLEPHPVNLALFWGFADWGTVVGRPLVRTVRLDDVPEAASPDLLKIDIQGGELMVFENAPKCLASALAIQTEVYFIEHYIHQPLFSTIDQFLVKCGFRLYRFDPIFSRPYFPVSQEDSEREKPRKFVLNYYPPMHDTHSGFSQFLWADALYLKDITRLERYTTDELVRLAAILHECYGAYDVVLRLLIEHDHRMGTDYARPYSAVLMTP